MIDAWISGIRYHLPDGRRTNDDLVRDNPDWLADRLFRATGIQSRPRADMGCSAVDLAEGAARTLIDECAIDKSKIDCLILCTQSAAQRMPASACLLQDRLGLPSSCGAFDLNLGCSGFTYCLWLARALIRAGEAHHVLLLISDTLGRFCRPGDRSTVPVFGDAGAAVCITSDASDAVARIGATVKGTDGRGAAHLMIQAAEPIAAEPCATESEIGMTPSYLTMNGPEVFSFALSAVPAGIDALLKRIELSREQIDMYLLHQANAMILEGVRKKLELPIEKLPIDMADFGNTAGASLPILMVRSMERGLLHRGMQCVLAGFGTGYSWAMTHLEWFGESH